MNKSIFIVIFILWILVAVFPKVVVANSQSQIQYDLPYPGILPDNPLYFLKVARDKIIIFFISDSLKKSQFDLLQSDKRLNAAVLLNNEENKNNILIISTASKAENYFNEAINNAKIAKQEGENIDDVKSKLLLATKKHYQVLMQIGNSSKSLKEPLKTIEKRVLIEQKLVMSLNLSKQSKNK